MPKGFGGSYRRPKPKRPPERLGGWNSTRYPERREKIKGDIVRGDGLWVPPNPDSSEVLHGGRLYLTDSDMERFLKYEAVDNARKYAVQEGALYDDLRAFWGAVAKEVRRKAETVEAFRGVKTATDVANKFRIIKVEQLHEYLEQKQKERDDEQKLRERIGEAPLPGDEEPFFQKVVVDIGDPIDRLENPDDYIPERFSYVLVRRESDIGYPDEIDFFMEPERDGELDTPIEESLHRHEKGKLRKKWENKMRPHDASKRRKGRREHTVPSVKETDREWEIAVQDLQSRVNTLGDGTYEDYVRFVAEANERLGLNLKAADVDSWDEPENLSKLEHVINSLHPLDPPEPEGTEKWQGTISHGYEPRGPMGSGDETKTGVRQGLLADMERQLGPLRDWGVDDVNDLLPKRFRSIIESGQLATSWGETVDWRRYLDRGSEDREFEDKKVRVVFLDGKGDFTVEDINLSDVDAAQLVALNGASKPTHIALRIPTKGIAIAPTSTVQPEDLLKAGLVRFVSGDGRDTWVGPTVLQELEKKIRDEERRRKFFGVGSKYG